MKKIILSIAAMAIAVSSFAQISVGAGYANNAAKSIVGSTEMNGTENGIFVEGSYGISLDDSFSIIPGVRYTYLGAQHANEIFGGRLGINGKVKEHFLAVPVSAQYALDLNGAKILIFAGPTFSLGLSSTTTGTPVTPQASIETRDNFNGQNLERVDILVGCGLGIEFGKLAVKAGYDFGLLDRSSSEMITRKDTGMHAGVYFAF